MQEQPQISVLMPAYNAGLYIEEAIKSILVQTCGDFEFIIINDGSTDNTEKIIRSFSDKRIRYIHHIKNMGLIDSLNEGLLIAKGKYIARMDADDIASPGRLEAQLEVFTSEAGVIATGSDYYHLDHGKLKLHSTINDTVYLKTILLFTPCFAHPAVMMKNIFGSVTLRYDKNFLHAEDYRLWTELSAYGRFYNVNQPLLRYRLHPKQISVEHRAAQLNICYHIRRDYLISEGFSFSEEQMRIHAFIGNNEVIRSPKMLLDIDAWLQELVRQNLALQKKGHDSFKRAIHKYWLDSCGNTRIGLRALRIFYRSPLSAMYKMGLMTHAKLLAKCVVRRFQN